MREKIVEGLQFFWIQLVIEHFNRYNFFIHKLTSVKYDTYVCIV